MQLRKGAARERSSDKESDPATAIDWSCQWWVGAHVRQQWYPSLQEHLPVYIAPFLKGPEDKPIKPRSTPLFAVTR